MSKLIAIFITLLATGLIALAFIKSDSLDPNINIPQAAIDQPVVSPMPFYELTVPYLKSREYSSQLGQLTKHEQYASYDSYLTSYGSDGLKINGLLTIPKDNLQKHPAIVFVHGYIAPSIYQTTEKYVDYVDYLARNGFVVFKIDLRGHGDSEGDPGGAYYSSDYVVDTLNAYSALQNADFVDSNAIGLWGHSMAGNVVFRSFAVNPSIPAVVIWAGAGYSYEDLVKYGLNDQSYRPPTDNSQRSQYRQRLRDMYGQFDSKSVFWQQIAPTNYLSDIKGAIELHHAMDDDVVNIGYSRDLISLLDKTAIPHQLYEYASGGHNIAGQSFAVAMQRTVEFFHKYLK